MTTRAWEISSLRTTHSLRLPSWWKASVIGLLAAVSLLVYTWIAFELGQSLSSTGFVYLIFIVLAAVYGGFWQATFVSVIAVASLDYFFEEPIFSFTIGRVSNWVQLVAFEFTALVVSTLSNRAHLRELEAVAERRDTAKLYEIARRILLIDPAEDPGNQIVALVREVFELGAVVLFDASSAKGYESRAACPQQVVQTAIENARSAYFLGTDRFDAETQTWFSVLRLGVRPVGSVALCGTNIRQLVWSGRGSSKSSARRKRPGKPNSCELLYWILWRINLERPLQ